MCLQASVPSTALNKAEFRIQDEEEGGGIINLVVVWSGGMPPQEKFDFGPQKWQYMVIWELLLSYIPAL